MKIFSQLFIYFLISVIATDCSADALRPATSSEINAILKSFGFRNDIYETIEGQINLNNEKIATSGVVSIFSSPEHATNGFCKRAELEILFDGNPKKQDAGELLWQSNVHQLYGLEDKSKHCSNKARNYFIIDPSANFGKARAALDDLANLVQCAHDENCKLPTISLVPEMDARSIVRQFDDVHVLRIIEDPVSTDTAINLEYDAKNGQAATYFYQVKSGAINRRLIISQQM